MSAKEKVLVALTVFCFTEATKVFFNDLLPLVAALVAGTLSP